METYRDRIAVTMPRSYAGPGASGAWRSSGAAPAGVLPVHQGTALPTAGDFAGRRAVPGFTPEMRITVPSTDLQSINGVTTVFTDDVPGPRTWSPPA